MRLHRSDRAAAVKPGRTRARKPQAEPIKPIQIPVAVKVSAATGRAVLFDYSGRVADLRAVAVAVNEARDYRKAVQGLLGLHTRLNGKLQDETDGEFNRRRAALAAAYELIERTPTTCLR